MLGAILPCFRLTRTVDGYFLSNNYNMILPFHITAKQQVQ